MKHIILATDFSDNAWRAMSYAAKLFSKTPCHYHLITSSRIPLNVMDGGSALDLDYVINNNDKSLADLLVKFKALSHHDSSTFKREALIGNTSQSINSVIEAIDDINSTITVIGSHGESGMADKLLGTTSTSILSNCTSAVLCVPEKCSLDMPKKFLLASDNNIIDKTKSLKSLSALISSLNGELLVANVRKNEEVFTEDSPEKIMADHFFKEVPRSFHNLEGKSVSDELIYFSNTEHVDLIVLLRKDDHSFSRLFKDSNIKTLNFYGKKPILVI